MKNWIAALRLKTLPLALGAIILGAVLDLDYFDWQIFTLACITAIYLQILSNLANDYGDYQKGTDKHRKDRQLSTGEIKPRQMLNAICLFAGASFLSGVYLLYISFGNNWTYWLVFFMLGVSSIIAAITYTVGKRAYGYSGLGDIFVFIFFGLVGVLGTSYLFYQELNIVNYLPAIAYGALCMGVLNVNNIRDIDKDVLTNKLTLAAKLGASSARKYQLILLVISFICIVTHHILSKHWTLAPLAILVVTIIHISKLNRADTAAEYNAQLKLLSIGSLLVSLFFLIQLF